MTNEPFMLVSLKEDKAKKLAQVMGSPTCTKILQYLAGKDATESQIAKDLDLPLSTVHYNIQQLVAAKLVVVDEFHYSEKGREVNHYKLAKKYIIIAPEDDDPAFLERLKKFIPAVVLTLGVAATLKVMQLMTGTLGSSRSDEAMMLTAPAADPSAFVQTADAGIMAAKQAVDTSAGDAAPAAMKMMAAPVEELANQTANDTLAAAAPAAFNGPALDGGASLAQATTGAAPSAHWWQSPMIDWFILGAVFVLVVLVLTEAVKHWRAKRKE